MNFGSQGDIVLMARGGRSGGSPTLSVKVDDGAFSAAKDITNTGAPVAYTYDLNVPAGNHIIRVRAGNTGTGRYPFFDYATFPAGGGGGTPTDTDGDGVPDSTDQCDTRTRACVQQRVPGDDAAAGLELHGHATDINPGDDIDAIINDRPRGPTRFCVHAGEYQVSDVARLKDGDTLDAEPGELDYVGPATEPKLATKPTPVVFLQGRGPDTLLSALGSRTSP